MTINKKIIQRVKVTFVKQISQEIFLLKAQSSYICRNSHPGQFVQVGLPNLILRRPFSIYATEKDYFYILFRIRGKGTKLLAKIKPQDWLDVLGPLGKGFDLPSAKQVKKIEKIILLAGGMGVAPLYFLAQKIKQLHKDKKIILIVGAKNKKEAIIKNFRQLAIKVILACEDNSGDYQGLVTGFFEDYIKSCLSVWVYSCGPIAMLSKVKEIILKNPSVKKCQASFEQFMGCGLGVCYGCAIATSQGYKRVCADGPVFNIDEVQI